MRAPVARPPGESDSEALLATTQALLGRHLGRRGPVIALAHRPSAYRTSSPLEELDAWLDDGTELRLVLKDLGPRALSPAARAAKPAFLIDPLREIEVYRDLLAPAALGTPTFYGASVEPESDRYWLLLERVAGLELYQVGELAPWQAAARWLAGLHARFGADERLDRAAGGRLIRYDAEYYRRWLVRANAFAERGDGARRRQIRWLAGRYGRVVELLTSLPTTLLHGELYASNVLVHDAEAGTRVAPVDWEMAAVGPGLVDLAALAAGGWASDERAALARAYYEAQPPPRTWAWDHFLRVLDHCRLHLAVQWLGWSSDWSPPREHAQDWLGEALHLAEYLDM